MSSVFPSRAVPPLGEERLRQGLRQWLGEHGRRSKNPNRDVHKKLVLPVHLLTTRPHLRKLIHVDVVPTDLDNSYCPYVELQGNIAATLALVTPQLKRAHRSALSQGILRHIKIYRDDLARLFLESREICSLRATASSDHREFLNRCTRSSLDAQRNRSRPSRATSSGLLQQESNHRKILPVPVPESSGGSSTGQTSPQ